jgi:hypothetical protein
VRRPLRDTLVKAPKIGGLTFPTTPEAANTRIAEILRDRCLGDMAVSGASDCPEIFAGYAKLCDQPEVAPKDLAKATPAKGKADGGTTQQARAEGTQETAAAVEARLAANRQADNGGCAVMKEISARYPPPAAGVSGSSR